MFLRCLDLVIRGLSKICFLLAALCLGLIAAYGALDVVFSLFVGGGLPVTREASSALLAAAVFLSFGYAQYTKKDIRVDVIFAHLPQRSQRISEFLSIVLGIVVFALLTWQSSVNFLRSWAIGETAMALYRFPIYPSKFALAIGSAAATLELIRQFVNFFVDHPESADAGANADAEADPDTLPARGGSTVKVEEQL